MLLGSGRSLGKVLYIAAAVVIAASAALSLVSAKGSAGALSARMADTSAADEPDPFNVLPAKGKFLVATRNLFDPRFQETVVLLIDYSPKGATGLIINRPSGVSLADVLPSVRGLKKQAVVYYGGPVEGYRMLMLIRSDAKPDESFSVFENVYVSSSKNTLELLAGTDRKGRKFKLYAGYAGWTAGQLDREVSHGDWFIVPADAESVFEKKSTDIWQELFQRGSAIQVKNRIEYGSPLALAVLPH